jgi:hypothetical protein
MVGKCAILRDSPITATEKGNELRLANSQPPRDTAGKISSFKNSAEDVDQIEVCEGEQIKARCIKKERRSIWIWCIK